MEVRGSVGEGGCSQGCPYLMRQRSRSSAKSAYCHWNWPSWSSLQQLRLWTQMLRLLVIQTEEHLGTRCIFSLWTFVPIFIYRQVTVLWTWCQPWNKWMSRHCSEALSWLRRRWISPGWSRIFCVLSFCLVKDFRIKYLMLKALMIIINLLCIYICIYIKSWVTPGIGFILWLQAITL